MERKKQRGSEGRREGDLTAVLKGSPIIENVLWLAKHEIMNVTLFFSAHVTAYSSG